MFSLHKRFSQNNYVFILNRFLLSEMGTFDILPTPGIDYFLIIKKQGEN